MKRIDLTGKRFTRLTVTSAARSVRTRTGLYTMWNCLCACGRKAQVRTAHLTEGRTKSCGCFFLESLSKQPRGRKPDGTAYLRYVFGYYLKNAKNRSVDFKLDFDAFCSVSARNCHYCGASPAQGHNKSRLDRPKVFNGIVKHNGIDRINNTLGYTSKNVRPCCKHCNRAKRDRSEAEFKLWLVHAYHHWASK